jgi:diguanylate cyclase (GGDEF)-like protein
MLASRLGVGFLVAAGCMILTLERSAGVEVALALINMTIVAMASWRFRTVGRWTTVGLAAAGWSAAQLVGGGIVLSEIPREALAWHVGLRLAALASVAATVGAGRAAVRRLLRTEDALALSLLHERDSARRDRLTRLWNSRYLHEALEGEIYRCRRYARPFGLLVVDLDGFKAVNDTAGHEAGDRVLQAVGRVIRENCRATDIPARLGGDEFAVILPEASRLTVPRYALKLVDLVGALSFPPGQPRVTASVGAIAFERAPESVEAALGAADDAMYAAKREGKNRVVVHEAGGS